MYIQPTSTLKLLKNCPLDNTYDHTIFFKNQKDQLAYFNSLVKPYCVFDKLTYTRVNKGVIRVDANAELIYDCNYLMFQNERFGIGKWFFAFINKIEYVNEKVSELTFEIDVMQTWAFDSYGKPCYVLADCLIDRQHSISDNVGDNTLPENLELGEEYIRLSKETIANLPNNNGRYIVCVTTFDTPIYNPTTQKYEASYIGGRVIDKVYTGLKFNLINISTDILVEGFNAYLREMVNSGLADGIVAIYQLPNYFSIPNSSEWDNTTINLQDREVSIERKISGALDGYFPINNKLYTYPYNTLHIETDSSSADFAYEFFPEERCRFNLYFSLNPQPSATLIPFNYLSKITGNNNQYRLTLDNYPQSAWVCDTFKAYYAQNASSLQLKIMTQSFDNAIKLANAGARTVLGNPPITKARDLEGLGSKVNDALQLYAQLDDLRRRPPQCNGTQNGGVDIKADIKEFKAYHYSIRREYLEKIDKFFSMFGYKQNTVEHPYRCCRKYWTYLKTIGCDIHGSVPADDMKLICSIYDKGITFWRYANDIEFEVGSFIKHQRENTILQKPIH